MKTFDDDYSRRLRPHWTTSVSEWIILLGALSSIGSLLFLGWVVLLLSVPTK